MISVWLATTICTALFLFGIMCGMMIAAGMDQRIFDDECDRCKKMREAAELRKSLDDFSRRYDDDKR